ncbi:MAG: HIT family protein [Desulfomonile tiedjei]|nr:HIT family protein [Desulfomonile tiedjei]
MRTSKDCIFCKIAAGEIPCTKLFEDDTMLVFMDISPLNRGHVLVIPKEHFENIYEIDARLYGRLYAAVCKLAKAVKAAVDCHGINVMQLNGKAANQVVPHLHIHIVPRLEGDGLTICAWEPVMGDKNEIEATAELIKARLP